MANTNLHKAKVAKNDEFYTQLSDVENELRHYKAHFKDKIVFCNCDDPTWSAFWKYFHLNFEALGLKKLISTHYDAKERTYKLEYEGGNDTDISVGTKTDLLQNGDFRSEECIEILKESDIVVSNPPFSLWRSYIEQLMEYNKKFVIVGNKNAITYKEFFPLIKDNKVWIGYNSPSDFMTPEGETKKLNGLTRWFTNLDIKKRHEDLILWQRYYDDNGNPVKGIESKYCRYDNYEAINVDKVADIPCDYYECIGVPITFLDKYNPEQFEIVNANSIRKGEVLIKPKATMLIKDKEATISCSQTVNVEREREREREGSERPTLASSFDEFARIVIRRICSLRVLTDGISMENGSMQGFLSVEEIREILIKDFGYTAKDIQYCNGVMGVPITFLDKYNPEQFEILELGNSKENFTPTKDYINAKKHMKDGKVIDGGAINCVLAIEQNEKPINKVYYTSDNSKYLVPPYARILIRKKV